MNPILEEIEILKKEYEGIQQDNHVLLQYNDKFQHIKEENIEELLFSGGAGAIAFQAGYAHALIQIVGKERLKEFKLGGVSAGAIIAGLFHFCLHQEKYDMKFFWENLLRKPFEVKYRKYYGFFTTGDILRWSAYEYFRLAEEINLPTFNGVLHFVTTTIGRYYMPKKLLIENIKSPEELGDALESTCNVPFIVKNKFFTSYKGEKTIDGGFTSNIPYKYEKSQKIFLNVLPKMFYLSRFLQGNPKNVENIQITQGSNVQFPYDYWVRDEQWADNMFLKGVLAAKDQEEMLLEKFKVKKQQK
ncbi:Acyl transferase/acyl hydrolase/lysophospholipase [Pseudocohnilembus persalinus]|uniref:Acyl transferase/acyl hydrolase/lysophospholipase n=1 Tax=Pseudocohnilembus persalinus TaxID=266149 RepID=A0A0V0Q7B1_PSEPJ|nr:Acyl transferase/acyl hydrolase/lysophospholipase [Pseudocohnilembus persalinus]|eukprot:KRW98131.1 Acyl transferase/acyl hydrolase/lysophospholipase [Pseudocohnilembus persalinus]